MRKEVLKAWAWVDLLLRAVELQAVYQGRQKGAGLEDEDSDEAQSGSCCEKLEDVQPHMVREEEMQDAQG